MKVTDVRAVIAIGLRGQFGLRGRLPWEGNRGREYVADVERFFELPRGHVVIMGQRTFTSVPDFAFKNRDIFADFLRGDSDGITYIDTIFLKPAQSENENVYFHELIHVIQWRLLGPDRFLLAYANGLECFGYRQSPLEAMAYDAESEFASSTLIFNAEKLVADKLGL